MSESASPKKIYYGWYILAACFFMMFLGMATRNSFGLFLKPMICSIAPSFHSHSSSLP